MLLIAACFVLAQLSLLVAILTFLYQEIARQYSDATDVPFVRTPAEAFPLIKEALDIRPGDIVYELGSGDGHFLMYCASQVPQARYVGIENNPLLVLIAWMRNYVAAHTNVQFIRADLLMADLSHVTKIYGYLVPSVMNKLAPKLESTFRGRFASRAFIFENKKPTNEVVLSAQKGRHGEHMLYVYDFRG